MDCCLNDTGACSPFDAEQAPSADPEDAPARLGVPARGCVACRDAGHPVTRKTILLMLKPESLDRVGGGEYRFCPGPGCRVVYFAEGGGQNFTTDDLRVRVGLKEGEGEVPLCYCFGFDEAGAREEIRNTGRSTIPRRISALIKQGVCECPARNPSGACCLGEVNRAIKRLQAAQESEVTNEPKEKQ
jgi:hypothetical protein